MKKSKLAFVSFLLITLLATSTSLLAQGNCLDFDGNDDYAVSISIGSISDKTLSAWVKLDDINQDGSGLITIQTGNSETGSDNFDSITYNETASGFGWGFGSHAWQRTSWSGIKETSTEEWVHISATYSDYSFKMYRNGELILTNTYYQAYDFPADAKVFIGVRCWSGYGFLNGQIDEVRVWDHVRTQSQIQDNMNNSLIGNESGLIAYYKLDEVSGQIAEDNTINSFDLTLGSTSGNDTNDPIWITSDAPLPVTLSSFTASFSEGSSLLSWTTQSESNNLGWNIYRSEIADPEDAFQVNSMLIPGAGTSTQPTEYIFNDVYEVTANTEYWYWLESASFSGETEFYGPVELTITIEENQLPEFPLNTVLHGNYPNPFNPSTTISFDIRENDSGELSIFNIKGQLIEKQKFKAGSYRINWDGSKYSSGFYFYNLKTDIYYRTGKMISMK